MIALLVVGLLWLNAPVVERDPTQCDIPTDTSGLIHELAVVKDSLTSELLSKPEQLDHSADANKMVQPSPSDRHEKAKREIIIFTRPNCPPCDQWKRCEQAKFEADGWVVAYCDQHNFGLTPHFSIEKNGKQYDHKGYLPFSKIDEVTR